MTTLDSELSTRATCGTRRSARAIECEIDSLPLMPGRYRIDVILRGKQEIQDGLQAAAYFDVEPGVLDGRPMPQMGADGDIVLAHSWRLPPA